ncbi:MAG: pyrroline-5-carboxylate reductase [Pseudomonadota bacterium]
MDHSIRLGFIGAGTAAEFMLQGLARGGYPATHATVFDPDADRCGALRDMLGVSVADSNQTLLHAVDAVVLAVKPQMLEEVLEELETADMASPPLVISVAAGVRTSTLKKLLGEQWSVARVMPNTPAQLGAGISGVFVTPDASEQQRQVAYDFGMAAGDAVWIPEEALMDVVTAVSGSGPAYYFLLTEVLQRTAQELGLDPNTAARLASATALGAARMIDQTGQSPAILRERVTSPGGTTERALDILRHGGFESLFQEAVVGAAIRGRELAEDMED